MDNINYKILINHCVNILDSHHYFTNKSIEVLINNNMNFYSEEDLYEKYILNKNLMLKKLFDSSYRHLKDEEYITFSVLSYLILFRLKELGYNNFKEIVDTQPIEKIHKLLEFILNEKNLSPDGCLKMIWKDLLDEEYIENEILKPLRSVLHQNKKIMEYLEKKNNFGKTVKKTTKVTKIKPFYLTKPKPRSFLEPTEIIYRKINPTILTDKVLNGSNDKEILLKKKEENKLRLMKRLEKDKENQLNIVKKTFNKPVNNDNPLPLPKIQLTKLPKFRSTNVKLNVATVLREEKFLQEQRKKKETDLNNIEIILNNKDFEEWTNKIKEQEYEERKLDELKKRFEIQLLHEDAIDAKENLIKEKQEIVQQIKEEKEENQRYIEKSKKIQDKINKKFIRQVHDIEMQANEAKKKLSENKKKNADEVKDELKEIRNQIQKQQEEEFLKKAELIKQIRLLEKYAMNYKPEVDLTETPNYGFLNEMSIAELKQRLALMKETSKEEENRQRELILSRKKEKNLIIKKIRQNIEKDRMIRNQRRKKNEKNKIERQKRLKNLLNENKNIQTNETSSQKSSKNVITQNINNIKALYFELQQRKEQRQKKRNINKKNKDNFQLFRTKFQNSNITRSNESMCLPKLHNSKIENNTINLTLKSDKFIVIPNNNIDNDLSSPELPNIYQRISENQFINIYQNNNDEFDISQEYDNSFSNLNDNSYFISPDESYDKIDYFTKMQLKQAEKNYEKKFNIIKNQDKQYNEELSKKQNEKKNMNVNFNLNEIES
ncbi:hypothetical protein LY90DRAFT_672457 [Neocallimastix californiae]|uniref:Uncharacterized protein n=1 Tax=Neocallimastix californiae TaxID=1754190 RepID=A0A1Y2BX40_9FUNG|nr:hypothetical protein LY90DRAFT_672457 [Neocallimastix californiae]|eukprot:ORY39234.1 hypothetical protein LY90DRAFT_672457 [Neocallimastix californiae]